MTGANVITGSLQLRLKIERGGSIITGSIKREGCEQVCQSFRTEELEITYFRKY